MDIDIREGKRKDGRKGGRRVRRARYQVERNDGRNDDGVYLHGKEAVKRRRE
jgi:hypothetical protein